MREAGCARASVRLLAGRAREVEAEVDPDRLPDPAAERERETARRAARIEPERGAGRDVPRERLLHPGAKGRGERGEVHLRHAVMRGAVRFEVARAEPLLVVVLERQVEELAGARRQVAPPEKRRVLLADVVERLVEEDRDAVDDGVLAPALLRGAAERPVHDLARRILEVHLASDERRVLGRAAACALAGRAD